MEVEAPDEVTSTGKNQVFLSTFAPVTFTVWDITLKYTKDVLTLDPVAL